MHARTQIGKPRQYTAEDSDTVSVKTRNAEVTKEDDVVTESFLKLPTSYAANKGGYRILLLAQQRRRPSAKPFLLYAGSTVMNSSLRCLFVRLQQH